MNKIQELTLEEKEVTNKHIKSIPHNIITLDEKEIESVLSIRTDGKYCKFTDKYLITVTRR